MRNEERLRGFIERNLVRGKGVEFTDEANLFALGFVSSLFAVQLANYVGTEFELTIDNEDLSIENFSSVNSIMRFIHRKRAAAGEVQGDPHQAQVIEEFREFAATEVRPCAAEIEDNQGIPRQLIAKLGAQRYLGANLPPEYGGLGLDAVHYGLLTEELGKACANTRSLLTVSFLTSESLLRWGTQEQKQLWLPQIAKGERIVAFALSEPEVGSDARSVQTAYRKVGDKYIINGRKKWISFGGIADAFMVVAGNDGAISTFLVERERPGISTSLIRGLLAGRGSYISTVDFEDVQIPEKNLVGQLGKGFEGATATALDSGRYSVAWAGLAIAQESLEAMVSYSRKRSLFGQRLRKFQLVRGMIGDATTEIHAARALCLRAGELRNRKDRDSTIETCIAKYFSSKAAVKVATDAVQIHGGNGCCADYPVERLFREAKILEIVEGASQLQQDIIASYALHRYDTGRLGS